MCNEFLSECLASVMLIGDKKGFSKMIKRNLAVSKLTSPILLQVKIIFLTLSNLRKLLLKQEDIAVSSAQIPSRGPMTLRILLIKINKVDTRIEPWVIRIFVEILKEFSCSRQLSFRVQIRWNQIKNKSRKHHNLLTCEEEHHATNSIKISRSTGRASPLFANAWVPLSAIIFKTSAVDKVLNQFGGSSILSKCGRRRINRYFEGLKSSTNS